MEATIHNPHDRFFRASLSDPRVARDFLGQHLPAAIKAVVDLSTLKLEKESYVDKRLQLQVTDVLFSVNFQGKKGYIYVLIEHQSTPDKLLPFRSLKYNIQIIEQYLKNHQHKKLPIIHSMLFYTGIGPYPYSTDLFDLFEEPKELAKHTFLQPLQLIDISQIPDEELKKNAWSGVMEMCMKYAKTRDLFLFLKDVINLLKEIEKCSGSQYAETALTYLLRTTEAHNKEKFEQILRANLSAEVGGEIMTLADLYREEGKLQGKREGKKEGKIEAKKEIAQTLLRQGLSTEIVSQITHLPLREIIALNNLILEH